MASHLLETPHPAPHAARPHAAPRVPRPTGVRESNRLSGPDPALDALVDCARSGDADAFRDVVGRFGPPLVRFVMRFTGRDTEFANDVVQDALVAAWCNLDSIRDAGHLRPWLYRVARFKAVDQLRRRGPGGVPMQSLDLGRELAFEPLAPSGTDPASRRVLIRQGARRAVQRVLAELPPQHAGAVRLHYLHGLPISETARLLGLPKPTVKMRLHRARRTLRRLLREELHPSGPSSTPREGSTDGIHDT